MGVEDEIRTLLAQGHTPQSLLGSFPVYKKSTVYKIHRDMSTKQVPVVPPQWIVVVSPDPEGARYLPGTAVRFACDVRNTASQDLYITRSGMQPEWLHGQWHVSPERFLLRPRESRTVQINVPIPQDVALGEYDLRFGMEGQYLMPHGAGVPTVGWADPFVLHVKRPLAGYKLFLSHSVQDLHLVRQVERQLDIDGIEVFIAEDISTPGAVLEEKFRGLIREAHFFLALLTEHGGRSEWVIKETNYAHQINKPMLLLREKEAQNTSPLASPREWVEFSRFESHQTILWKIGAALGQLQHSAPRGAESEPVHPLVWVGLGLLFGVILSGGKGNSGSGKAA